MSSPTSDGAVGSGDWFSELQISVRPSDRQVRRGRKKPMEQIARRLTAPGRELPGSVSTGTAAQRGGWLTSGSPGTTMRRAHL